MSVIKTGSIEIMESEFSFWEQTLNYSYHGDKDIEDISKVEPDIH